tara:strand:- start:1280 stop:1714 length:435 start_codon:yes stop_codon:yes gene_type:complete
MKDHYLALVNSGFLSKANKQLSTAVKQLAMENDQHDEAMWYFNREEKKLDFDSMCDYMDIREALCNSPGTDFDSLEYSDVVIMHTSDFIIFCSRKKRAVEDAMRDEYYENGTIPYYTTKRTINNTVVWFCFSWLHMPFNPGNDN